MKRETTRPRGVLTIAVLCLFWLAMVPALAGVDGDGQTRSGGDCDDGDAGVYAGAIEVCDGRDDDCDGAVDEGCARDCLDFGGDDTLVFIDQAASYEAGVAAVAGRTLLSLIGIADGAGPAPGLHLWAVGPRGEPLRDSLIDANPLFSSRPFVTTRGDGPVAAWVREGSPPRCYYQPFDAEHQPLHPATAVSAADLPCRAPSVAWSGFRFGDLWVEEEAGQDLLVSQLFDIAGTAFGPRTVLSHSGVRVPAAVITWSGTAFGVLWVESSAGQWNVYHVEVNEGGTPTRLPRLVHSAAEPVSEVDLIWSEDRYEAAWSQESGGVEEVVLVELLADGTPVGAPQVVSPQDGRASTQPSLSWTGSRVVAAWHEPSSTPALVMLRSFAAGLVPQGESVSLTAPSGPLGPPSVVWTGTHLAVAHRAGGEDALAVTLVGCTDGDTDGAAQSVGDCQDRQAAIHQGAAEVCDGLDQNCDLYPDDGCGFGSCPDPRHEPAIPLVDLVATGTLPWQLSMAWAGDRFGLAWLERRDEPTKYQVFFQVFDPQGNALSAELKVTDGTAEARTPEVVWNGERFALFWEDDRDYPPTEGSEVYVQMISADGTPLTAPRQISEMNTKRWPGLGMQARPIGVWTGRTFLVAWTDYRDDPGGGYMEIYSRVLDEDGKPLAPPWRVTDEEATAESAHLAWNGTTAGMAFILGTDLYFLELGPDGRPVAPRVGLDPLESRVPRIVWAGDRYVVAYRGRCGGDCSTAMIIDRDGVIIAGPIPLTGRSSDRVRIVWAGEEVGVAWYDYTLPAGADWLTRVGLDGSILSEETIVQPEDGTLSNSLGLAWTGREYDVVYSWQDSADTNEEYLAKLTCCRDMDSDGVSLCSDCDDADPARTPGAAELCDGIDNDCDSSIDNGAPAPGEVTGLIFLADGETLEWDEEPGAESYDLIRGDLTVLLSSSGNFADAVEVCLAAAQPAASFDDPETPAADVGWFYMVRARGCGDQAGTYDTGSASQSAPRDGSIATSPAACP